MVLMNIGEYKYAGHAHLDSGHFSLYYKGNLAVDSGVYGQFGSDHFLNYQQRTVAHNSLLILDPAEPKPIRHYDPVQSRDGGQFWPRDGNRFVSVQDILDDGQQATVEAVEIHSGVIPDYAYLKGDLAQGYNAPASYDYPPKVQEVKRSFVFLNLQNDLHPAALVVYDRVVSSNAAFRKSWLLHTVSEPQIVGDQIDVRRTDGDNNGKLVNTMLLPSADNRNITKIGGPGFEFWVDGQNYPNLSDEAWSIEAGAWRVEISPLGESETDRFLNVMQVMDADGGPEPLAVNLIDSDLMTGLQIHDRIVMFSKNGADLSQEVTITTDDAPDQAKILVTDVNPGFWRISINGQKVIRYASETGKTLYFDAPPGIYTLTPIDAELDHSIYLPQISR